MTATQHPIDVTRGADLRTVPRGVNPLHGQPQPPGTVSCKEARELSKQIAGRVKPTKRRKNIMSMLATGWLPWGIRWDAEDGFACLSLHDREYIMCCGHVLKAKEAQEFVDAGLLMAGSPDRFGRPTLVITEAGREWLVWNW